MNPSESSISLKPGRGKRLEACQWHIDTQPLHLPSTRFYNGPMNLCKCLPDYTYLSLSSFDYLMMLMLSHMVPRSLGWQSVPYRP